MSEVEVERKKRRWSRIVAIFVVTLLVPAIVIFFYGPVWLMAPVFEELERPFEPVVAAPGHIPDSIRTGVEWLDYDFQDETSKFVLLTNHVYEPLSGRLDDEDLDLARDLFQMFRSFVPALTKPDAWRAIEPGFIEWQRAQQFDSESKCEGQIAGNVGDGLEVLSVCAIRLEDSDLQSDLREVWASLTHVQPWSGTILGTQLEAWLRETAVRWWSYLARAGVPGDALRPQPSGGLASERIRRMIENGNALNREFLREFLANPPELGPVDQWRNALELAAWFRQDRASANFAAQAESWSEPKLLDAYESEAYSWLTSGTFWGSFSYGVPNMIELMRDLEKTDRAIQVLLFFHDDPESNPPPPFRTAVLSDGARVLYDSSTTSAPSIEAVTEDYLLPPVVSKDVWFLPSRTD